MKVFGKILKVLAALAAIAGAVYVIATYGDKIVAWAKDLLAKFGCDCCCEDDDCCCCCDEDCCDDEECCCGCYCDEDDRGELVAEADAPEEDAVQADEADFEG